MAAADDIDVPDETPEADLVEQLIPVDTDIEEDGLDPTRVPDATDADEADLIDQAISVPLPADDYRADQ
jgi:hypothetical protein